MNMDINNDSLILNELTEYGDKLKPSKHVEHALAEINDTFQAPILAKIPFTEMAALGGAFAGAVSTLVTPAAEGVYRCVFPNGLTGTLAMAKDGSGALGTIINESGIAGQARWIPVDKAIGPACLEATKDIRSYVEQIEGLISAKKKILNMQTASQKNYTGGK